MLSLSSFRILSSSSSRINCIVYGGSRRLMHKVGDKIPINYAKDGKDPVVKDDKEYPDWIFQLSKKQPTKNELMKKLETEGLDKMSIAEKKRLKRLITLDEIRTNNLIASTGGS